VAFGVYLHFPFCRVRCDYCDFATFDDRAHLINAYVDACATDLRRRASGIPGATSIFLGGGTPSLLAPEQVARLLGEIDHVAGAEVTLEANPDTVSAARLRGYKAAGVTRLSIGVQSTRSHVLEALGRTHRPEHVRSAVDAARSAGIEEVSVDLIYGAACESLEDWRSTVADVLDLGVDHVSAYALTVEAGTPLALRVAAGDVRPPDDDHQADAYLVAESMLGAAGLEWYEISSWARPGHECRHNLLYWEQGEYLGVGAAAHGHVGGRRWWNVRTPERYIDAVGRGELPEAGSEVLDAPTGQEEAFALALRTRAGAEVGRGVGEVAADLEAAGLLSTEGDRIVLTTRGRLMASDVTARLLPTLSPITDPPSAAARPPTDTRYH